MAPNGGNIITFTEVDEINNPVTEFIYSELPLQNRKGKETTGRVDLAHASSASTPWSARSLQALLIHVFLPAGYPHSVSNDYVSYQIFDSLQAFSSSIAGLLSSRAVLQGVGVGNANASPTSALLLHILQDTSGRIATILFAHRVGTALEPECKMYRFTADIFNDFAMVLDCLSPIIPAGVSRVTVLSAAGVLRALCGVAGGSSKASLSAHFARWGNLAEVNAKDSSQETVISLIGMLFGSLVVSHITSFTATWLTLILLLVSHLTLNYAAVRSVQMTTLNRQRANIVFSTLLSSDQDVAHLHNHQTQHHPKPNGQTPPQILTPAEVSKQERIFQANNALKWYPSLQNPDHETLGTCQIGVSLPQFLSSSSPSPSSSNISKSEDYSYTTLSGSRKTTLPLRDLTSLFADEDYILSITPTAHLTNSNYSMKIDARILLKPSSTPKSHLKAWMHALLVARILSSSSPSSSLSSSSSHRDPDPDQDRKLRDDDGTDDILSILSLTLAFMNDSSRFKRYIDALREVGWDVDLKEGVSALETRVGRRVVVVSSF
ncbi:vitamin B6 photo-protection and homoeostasis-domain-containing protein [Aspergillus cavernicola]|uniref:Vitamin B6 photo-protection and homoeostasis-domain-containing protein n=1 Tax=Aspergillus cavernicola TaxID=176166 RepID=A0ABR4ILT3_9EURO